MRKRRDKIPAGTVERGERKRTACRSVESGLDDVKTGGTFLRDQLGGCPETARAGVRVLLHDEVDRFRAGSFDLPFDH